MRSSGALAEERQRQLQWFERGVNESESAARGGEQSQGKIVSTLKIYEAVKSIRYDIGHHVLLTRVADAERNADDDDADGVFEILCTWSLQTETHNILLILYIFAFIS